MFDGLYFEYPKVFSFIVVFIACEAYCKMRGQALYFPQLRFIYKEAAPYGRWLKFLQWSAVVLLLFAMMSPVKEEVLELNDQKRSAVVFVLASEQVTKMQDFKELITNYVEAVTNSSFSLVVASLRPWLLSPPTEDKKPFLLLLGELDVQTKLTETGYTSTLKSVHLLWEKEEDQKKVVVFLHTSKTAMSDPLEAVKKEMRSAGVVFYDIAFLEGTMEAGTVKDTLHNIEVNSSYLLQQRWKDVVKREDLLSEAYHYVFKSYYYFYPLFLAFVFLLSYLYLRNRREH